MASVWHQAFRTAGFSENWLRTVDVAPTERKRELWFEYQNGADVWRCFTCSGKYMRANAVRYVQQTGRHLYCSSTCYSESPYYAQWQREQEARRIAAQERRTSELAGNGFYDSDEWRAVRYEALRRHGNACQACGRRPFKHGVVIHVDHIKPRSTHPHLALDIDNLQVLCEACNMGKSNRHADDWR